jgi:alpha-beta hydrolase superfamily lysophospholipase
MAWDISDYFREIDWAVETIARTHPRLAVVVGHSTGGLIASLYLAGRAPRQVTNSLVLTSPFLRFRLSPKDRALTIFVSRLARFFPALALPQQVPGVYSQTIHCSHQGEWDYDLSKKPIEGVQLHAGWFRMIRAAHRQMRRGLRLEIPILTLHSDKTRVPGDVPTPEDFESDLVLDVKDMIALSPHLGKEVTLKEIAGGVHDLTLSKKPVREAAIEAMVDFVRWHDHE